MKRLGSALLLPVLLLACASEAPEAQVKRAFEACMKGVETGDPGSVIERLDPKFIGPEGMDRNGAKLYLVALLRREKIGVTVLSSRTEATGDDILQTIELVLTSRSGGGLLPQDASRRSFLLRWVESDGKWRLRELIDQTGSSSPAT